MTEPLSIDERHTVRTDAPNPDVPLLVVIHGYGAHERDLVPLRPHLGEVEAVFLRAPLTLSAGSYAWFPITTLGNPDVASVDAAALGLLAWLDEHAAGRTVIFLGFSQGSTVGLQAARLDPTRFAAGLVLSGFVVPRPHAGDGALARAALPVFFGHGTADPIIPPATTAQTAAWLAEHSTLTEHTYPGLPHGISGEELSDVRAFLAGILATS